MFVYYESEGLLGVLKEFFELCKQAIYEWIGNATAVDTDTVLGKAYVNRQAERIMDEYGNSILRLAYSYLHNNGDAEEVLQDTLVQYITKAPDFVDNEHEKAWLLRVAANISKNRISFNKVRQCDELNDQLVARKETDLSFVWEAVKKLPMKYREVIHLYYYEEYSTSQIAYILRKNEATIRSLLHRGRKLLKDVLKEEYDFENTL